MSSIHSADRGSIFGYLLKQQKRATARSEPANATVVHKMYTERALEMRAKLRFHPDIVAEMKEYWILYHRDREGRLFKPAYLRVNRLLARAVVPSWGNMTALIVAFRDWNRDTQHYSCRTRYGVPYLNSVTYFDSLFELVDVWCDTIQPKDYVNWLISKRTVLKELMAEAMINPPGGDDGELGLDENGQSRYSKGYELGKPFPEDGFVDLPSDLRIDAKAHQDIVEGRSVALKRPPGMSDEEFKKLVATASPGQRSNYSSVKWGQVASMMQMADMSDPVTGGKSQSDDKSPGPERDAGDSSRGPTRPRHRAESKAEAASVAPGGSRAQGDDASTQGSDAKSSVGSSEDDKRNMVTSGKIDVGPKTNPNSQVDYKGSGASRFSTDLLLADAGTTLREPTPADEAYSSRSGGASPASQRAPGHIESGKSRKDTINIRASRARVHPELKLGSTLDGGFKKGNRCRAGGRRSRLYGDKDEKFLNWEFAQEARRIVAKLIEENDRFAEDHGTIVDQMSEAQSRRRLLSALRKKFQYTLQKGFHAGRDRPEKRSYYNPFRDTGMSLEEELTKALRSDELRLSAASSDDAGYHSDSSSGSRNARAETELGSARKTFPSSPVGQHGFDHKWQSLAAVSPIKPTQLELTRGEGRASRKGTTRRRSTVVTRESKLRPRKHADWRSPRAGGLGGMRRPVSPPGGGAYFSPVHGPKSTSRYLELQRFYQHASPFSSQVASRQRQPRKQRRASQRPQAARPRTAAPQRQLPARRRGTASKSAESDPFLRSGVRMLRLAERITRKGIQVTALTTARRYMPRTPKLTPRRPARLGTELPIVEGNDKEAKSLSLLDAESKVGGRISSLEPDGPAETVETLRSKVLILRGSSSDANMTVGVHSPGARSFERNRRATLKSRDVARSRPCSAFSRTNRYPAKSRSRANRPSRTRTGGMRQPIRPRTSGMEVWMVDKADVFQPVLPWHCTPYK